MTQLLEAANANSIFINQDNIKKFANRLKKSLEKDSIKFKTSKCYDILAQTLGSSNWHELSQQLSTAPTDQEIDYSLATLKNEKQLKSIFDYPWHEFKYFISQVCEVMGYSEKIKIFTLSLLEVIKDRNRQGSHLLWDKLNMILSYNKFDLFVWVNDEDISLDYYLNLNNNLEENVKATINADLWPFFPKTGQVGRGEECSINIMKIFKLLNYLYKENIIIHENFSQLKANDITENIKNYPILYELVSYADMQKTDHNLLSLHEVIFNLYSRVIDVEKREIFRIKDNIIKSLLNDLDFCSYVIDNAKERIYSKANKELQNNTLKINLYLNYIDFSDFKEYIVDSVSQLTDEINTVEVNIEINEESINIKRFKQDQNTIIKKFAIYIHDDYYLKKILRQKNISLKINSINI